MARVVIYGKELYHHGIKGQRWGIRRTKEELFKDPESRAIAYKRLLKNPIKTKNGIEIKRVSKHIIDETRFDRTQSPNEVVDALINPLSIGPIKEYPDGRRSITFVGKKATTCINPDDGTIITSHVTGSRTLRKFAKGGRYYGNLYTK